jgi:hypothetical protein
VTIATGKNRRRQVYHPIKSLNMSKRLISGVMIYAITFLAQGLASCGKEFSSTTASSATSTQSTASTVTSSSAAIAVATDSATGDSIYILQTCARGFFRDSVSASNLPDSIASFLNSNYPGYIFMKAFAIRDSAGSTNSYVVIVTFDGKPVGLLFSAGGSFLQVLEQRESGDLSNQGWHEGGRFSGRDGLQQDTLAVSSLPASITGYFSAGYPGDTLLKVFRNIDSSYLVISADNGLYATLFSSQGNFIQRNELPAPPGPAITLPQDSLPASVLSSLASAFPGYVFEKAFAITTGIQVAGYLVVLDANGTKYAVWFDSSGNTVAVKTLW